jgi:hypothetical protein
MHNDDRHLYEELLESTQIFRGKLLDLRRDRVRLPDGKECQREYVRHQGAVAVIAQLADGQLLFVRQYRYPLSRSFLELPAERSIRAKKSLPRVGANCSRRPDTARRNGAISV